MIGLLGIGSHSKLKTLLSSYIDDQVSPEERSRVEQHLSGCDECLLNLETLRMSVGLLRDLPELQVPRSFRLQAAPAPVRAFGRLVWATGLATSAAAVLLAALVVGDALEVFRQGGQGEVATVATPLEVDTPAAAPPAAPAPVAAAVPESAPAMAEAVEAAAAAPAAPAPVAAAEPESAPVMAEADKLVEEAEETEAPLEQPMAAGAVAPPAESAIKAMPQRVTGPPLAAQEAPAMAVPAAAAEAEPEIAAESTQADMAQGEEPTPTPAPRHAAPSMMAAAPAPERPADERLEVEPVAEREAAVAPDAAPSPDVELEAGPSTAPAPSQDTRGGVALPLRQLQYAAGVLAALLLGATVVLARRRWGQGV